MTQTIGLGRGLAVVVSGLLLGLSPATSQADPTSHSKDGICPRTGDMPSGYRMERYRRPTPKCAPGAVTLSTLDTIDLIGSDLDPLLIDVGALLLRTEQDFGSEWLPTGEHLSLPGAIWLPNVGKGQLQPPIDLWFGRQLQRLTNGNFQRALVFFCVADCWMSWNASIRAQTLGYTHVYWYRDGTSGWTEAGRTLVPVKPEAI